MDDFPSVNMVFEKNALSPLPHLETPVTVGFALLPEPTPDEELSKKAGYPVFKERVLVKITVPGDKQTVFIGRADEEHKRKYPKAWAQFEAIDKTATSGFPIEQWPQLPRGMALTLKAMHINTVEMLAEVNDAHITALGHMGRELRSQAQAFIALAKDTAAAQATAKENEQLKAQMAQMQEQINALAAAGNEAQGNKRGKAA